MTAATEILLITGPAGVGKSTLRCKMQQQLARARVPHAMIESADSETILRIIGWLPPQ